MSSASARYLPLAVRVLRGIFWTALFAVLAAGGAGLIGTAWHAPGSPVRAELTWTGDAALGARLDTATATLAEISDEVETLADAAKTALAEVTNSDPTLLRDAVARGTEAADTIEARAGALRESLADLPGGEQTAITTYSNPVLVRRSNVLAAAQAAAGLAVYWRHVAARAIETANLTALLDRHDQTVIAATADGRDEHWQRAVRILDDALQIVADVQSARAKLIAGSDGTVLDEWITRNRDFDSALQTLYAALRDSGGNFQTTAVQKAFVAEERAKDRLPPDRRTVIVIVSEVTSGGLTEAVIEIEDARGQIEDALDAEEPDTPSESPDTPGPSAP
jgi:hypothetical protein